MNNLLNRIFLSFVLIWIVSSYIYATITVTSIHQPSIGNADGQVCIELTGTAGPFDIIVDGPNPYWQELYAVDGLHCFGGMIEGQYIITITDQSGCEEKKVIEIFTKCPLQVTVVDIQYVSGCVDPACQDETDITITGSNNCNTDGSITLAISGADNYSVSWSSLNNFVSTNEHVSGLSEGIYFYRVEHNDLSSCVVSGQIPLGVCNRVSPNINEPGSGCEQEVFGGFLFNPIVTNVSAAGMNDGRLYISSDQEFYYTLTSVAIQVGSGYNSSGYSEGSISIENLGAGIYYLDYTIPGCQSLNSRYGFRICEPIEMRDIKVLYECMVDEQELIFEDTPTCAGFGSIGSLDSEGSLGPLEVVGGVPPYYFFLQAEGENVIRYNEHGFFNNLCETSYTLFVQDVLGCTSETITIEVDQDEGSGLIERIPTELHLVETDTGQECENSSTVCEFFVDLDYSCNSTTVRSRRIPASYEFTNLGIKLILTLPEEYGLPAEQVDLAEYFDYTITTDVADQCCCLTSVATITFKHKGQECTTYRTRDNAPPEFINPQIATAGYDHMLELCWVEWGTGDGCDGASTNCQNTQCNSQPCQNYTEYYSPVFEIFYDGRCVWEIKTCTLLGQQVTDLIHCYKDDITIGGSTSNSNDWNPGNDETIPDDVTCTHTCLPNGFLRYDCSDGNSYFPTPVYSIPYPVQYRESNCPSGWACGKLVHVYSDGNFCERHLGCFDIICTDGCITVDCFGNEYILDENDNLVPRDQNSVQYIESNSRSNTAYNSIEISKKMEESDFVIRPNPFTNDFILKIDNIQVKDRYFYTIFSNQGQIIATENINLNGGKEITINSLRDHPDGIYTLLLQDEEGLVETFRMVKIR